MANDDRTVILSHIGRVAPGTRLNGIYQVDALIGSGGMSEIYRGHNIQTLDKVAIKVVLPQFANDEHMVSLFRREALILNRLSHQSIIRYHVFSHDAESDLLYLAMELVEGPTLRERIAQRPLSQLEACQLVARVAQGMSAAHREGIIHRDLSTDNIVLADGDVARPKVIDFGIARSGDSTDSTLIQSGFAGKFNYVSPEQLGLFGGQVGPTADIYSLGLVFAAALLGKPLDMAGSHAEVVMKRQSVPDLSRINPGVKPLIERMLQPNPVNRVQSMDDVAAALQMASGSTRESTNSGRPTRPGSVETHHGKTGEARKSHLPVLAALVVLIGGAAFGGWWITHGRPDLLGLVNLVSGGSEQKQKLPSAAMPTGPTGKSEVKADAEAPTVGTSVPPTGGESSTPGAQGPNLPAQAVPAEETTAGEKPVPAKDDDVQDSVGQSLPSEPSGNKEAAARPVREIAPRISLDEEPGGPAAPPAKVESPEVAKLEEPGESALDVADWLRSFRGGDCFYARAIDQAGKRVAIEGFSLSVQPLERLERQFKSTFGFEPPIGMRAVREGQCPVVAFAGTVGDPVSDMKITLKSDVLSRNEELEARISRITRRHVSVFLVAADGGTKNVTHMAKTDGRDIVLALPPQGFATGKEGYLLLAVAADKPLKALDGSEAKKAASVIEALRREAAENATDLTASIYYFRRN
ncbi:protein kinase domain-containing protein [Mesorhizobium retamae]|uniref:Protein kinase n=1 Tax=Mesorhizobium retamae TaxID=2912854 RepID=A0ABS9Q9H7_9HYPH|nr:protein kinase [Mesorhizobium sp. IRAMC:0171]MCG7504056.1 protein kinase [Mesorhizobium sp. IRAMC:0171]